jgi:hypothetical protein
MGNFLVQAHLIGIFEWVEELFLEEGNATTTTALDRASTTTWTPLPSSLQEITRSERAMLRACTRTMQILQYLLDNTSFDPRYLEQLRQELKSDLDQTDPLTWVRYTVEANLWAMNIGMALSDTVDGRLSFLFDKQCIAMSIRATDTALHERF